LTEERPAVRGSELTVREMVLPQARGLLHICPFNSNQIPLKMKKLLWSIAAVSLLAMGCSKEEMEESVTEGVSALAVPVSQQKNGGTGSSHVWNELWFNHNQGRMWVNAKGPINRLPQNCNPSVRVVFGAQGSDDPNEVTVMQADLCRVGNSRNYRSAANSFNFSDSDFFSLVDVQCNWNASDGTPQEYAAQLFLYPSGRTVVQDPKVMRVREQENGNMIVTVADDPAEQIAFIEYRKCSESIMLEKTHVNQALGISRWACQDACLAQESPSIYCGQTAHFRLNQGYEFDYFEGDELLNRTRIDVLPGGRIYRSYTIGQTDGPGPVAFEESQDPVIIGSRLASSNNGGTYNLTVAVAELGDALQTVRCTFGESDGPAPIGDTFQMELVGEGAGGLKVYEVRGVRFNGNPAGSEYEIFYQLGTGTRSSAGTAKTKAELL
jgi:hypothetical protein